MTIIAKVDTEQSDTSGRNKLAICPHCGQKLFEVESIYYSGLFRHKCRRCKKYIRVSVIDKGD